jgi:hypothetical protein
MPPSLIEQNVRHYTQVVLTKCYDHRVQFYSWALNIVILVVFGGITALSLWYCYSRKLSPEERAHKQRKDQEYVLTKIRQFQMEKDQQRDQFTELVRRVTPAQIMTIPSSSVAEMDRNPADKIYDQVMGR